jgi:murein DD-endopeptidase MepM/ murein hydrolase activator NlpD
MPQGHLGTFMFVPRRTEEIRTIAITRTGLLGLGAFVLLILSFVSLVVFQLLLPTVPASPQRSAHTQNGVLVAELDALEDKLAMLDGQMGILLRRNEELRTLANLPRIPVEVAAVGVGGPGHEETAGLPSPGEAANPVLRRLSRAESDLDVLLRRSKLVSRSMREAETIIRTKTERWSSTPSIWPTDGFLSSSFSYARKHPLLGSFRPHYGVDISARAGNKVVATADGAVTFAGWRSGSGNHVEIDHGFGIRTTYSHNAKLLVRSGEQVRRGTPIGYVGSTGFSLGPHVHYEVHKQGQPVDPTKYIFPNVAAD